MLLGSLVKYQWACIQGRYAHCWCRNTVASMGAGQGADRRPFRAEYHVLKALIRIRLTESRLHYHIKKSRTEKLTLISDRYDSSIN